MAKCYHKHDNNLNVINIKCITIRNVAQVNLFLFFFFFFQFSLCLALWIYIYTHTHTQQ
jgi:hypothetical protein